MATKKVNRRETDARSFYVSFQQHVSSLKNSPHLNSVHSIYSYFAPNWFYLVAPSLAILISCAKIKRMPAWGDWSLFEFITFALSPGLLIILVAYFVVELLPRSTYLVDFACFHLPEELQITREEFIKLAKESGNFNSLAIDFQHKTLQNSGIGDTTHMPRSVFEPAVEITLNKGREEAALVLFATIDDLFAGSRIQLEDINILVVNCGVLNTTPSLSAMLVNHYMLRHDILSYNLGGMGCAAGGIAVSLARDLLDVHPGSYALVVSTEIMISAWYAGNNLDMLSTNCTFRMGAAAMLLSNHRLDWWHSKYELKQIVRTHKGMDDRSFECMHLNEDAEGKQGLYLSKDLLDVTTEAIEDNIAHLCYKHSFKHICILATCKNTLDELQKKLELTDEDMEASRRTLERFGNTSSSSMWYELAYLEACGRVKKGHKVWQLAFGSGFKCTSIVWEALGSIERRPHRRSLWMEYVATN